MRSLDRRTSFWLIALSLLVVMIAAGAPSPLYVVYQQRIGFSSSTLTVIFAVYVLALLGSLLTVGSLSDFIGRRPVLLAGLAVEVASLLLFLPADSVGWLVAARVVQGLATGAVIGALGAALVDTQPPGSNLGTVINSAGPALGLALGALGSGALIQYAPNPTQLVFLVLIAAVIAAGLGILAVPETTGRQPGALASLRPQVRVHREVRAPFLAAVPIFIATWAVAGLYLSLGGSLAVGVFGLHNHLVGGLVVAAVTGSGAVASVLFRETSEIRSVLLGTLALVLGLLITLLGIERTDTATFFLGSVVAGFGFGASFLGSFRTVAKRVGPDDRAATLAAVLSVSYLGFSVPAVIAGFVATHRGLRDTALGYGGAVVVLALLAIGTQTVQHRQARRSVALAAESVH
ncbi:MFS transporter [Jatrophihabitans telluris]|uniref:MFS transporter n=1 Tax=Jatrophihabitans telluris TaxID=2038343 RepID=A0ABY4QV51_9ACTN|nr:MFS transporter [Jatrophihabitans telluris]UQX87499.1 MFS transporter [Jatrophihabitans telluris]